MKNSTPITTKEWIATGHPVPWWVRVIAPLEHWIKIMFGHKPVNVLTFDTAHSTPGRGAPVCKTCGEIVGHCPHNG